MLEVQKCINGKYRFDLSELPAERIEANRRFGIGLCCFAFPFLVVLIYAMVFLVQNDIWIMLPFPCFFLLIVGAIFVWGMFNLLTKIHTRISTDRVEETTLRPWGQKSWEEPLSNFKLHMKVMTHRSENSASLSYSYHLRLNHSDDMKSISLHSAEFPEEAKEKFQLYQQQLPVQVDHKIRDYNTDRVIDSTDSYGLNL